MNQSLTSTEGFLTLDALPRNTKKLSMQVKGERILVLECGISKGQFLKLESRQCY